MQCMYVYSIMRGSVGGLRKTAGIKLFLACRCSLASVSKAATRVQALFFSRGIVCESVASLHLQAPRCLPEIDLVQHHA